MTPFRNFSTNATWTRRLRRGGLYVAVATLLGTHAASCGGGDKTEWEEVTTYEVTKGVVTTIEETEAGKFAIVDERVVDGKDSSRVIIKRLSGTIDTMTLDQARGLVGAQDTVYQTVNRHGSHGLGGILWWGAMGYMMGRSFGSPSPSNIYRNNMPSPVGSQLRQTAIPRTQLRPVSGKSGFFSRGARGGSAVG
jgi:hypothetical protein